ncbi:MAG TPA: DUF1588 domain-containing protein, partial [Polyangia bacterium]
ARWWLGLDNLLSIQKQDPDGVFSPALRQDLIDEVSHLGAHAFTSRDGRLFDLLTGRVTFVNQRLAMHYGMSGITGDQHQPVPFPDSARVGVFTTAGMLTLNASTWQPTWPARRTGSLVERLLCREVPDAPVRALPTDPKLPLREQTIAFTGRDGCPVCHHILDPPGFAFLEFDSFGRFRAADVDGRAFDTTGTFPEGMLASPLPFRNADELMKGIASRPETFACVAQMYLRHALGREDPLDAPSAAEATALPAIARAFAAADGRFDALVDAVVRSEPFLQP